MNAGAGRRSGRVAVRFTARCVRKSTLSGNSTPTPNPNQSIASLVGAYLELEIFDDGRPQQA